jgi:hypothetical protein
MCDSITYGIRHRVREIVTLRRQGGCSALDQGPPEMTRALEARASVTARPPTKGRMFSGVTLRIFLLGGS